MAYVHLIELNLVVTPKLVSRKSLQPGPIFSEITAKTGPSGPLLLLKLI